MNIVQYYMKEYFNHEKIKDPYSSHVAKVGLGREGYHFRTELGVEIGVHLLIMHMKNPSRLLYSYIDLV